MPAASESDVVVVPSRPAKSRMLKRKSGASLHASKRAKTHHSTVDDLPWHSVKRPVEAGHDDFGDIVMIEEVDGVDVVYEGEGEGRIARFEVCR